MTRATDFAGARLGRRRLLQFAGGGATLALLGRPGLAGAQDALTITMWGNHPEWKDPMLQILAAFEEANPDDQGRVHPDRRVRTTDQAADRGRRRRAVRHPRCSGEGSILTQVGAEW